MIDSMIEETKKITCKFCKSEHVIKYGTRDGVQRYWCKDCNSKFVNNDAIPKMQNSTKDIASALQMYYEGMSENAIRRNFIQQGENYISSGTVYNWVDRFTTLAENEADKYTPKVGDTWIADETYVRIDKHKGDNSKVENPYDKSRKAKWVVFWDIIDAKTRFLLASVVTTTRGTQDAKELMERAAKRAGKTPKIVITDKLASYLEGIEQAYGADTEHKQGAPFDIQNNTNLIERFHETLKMRTKVMRALKNKRTLQRFTDGWLVYYNFLRPHMGIEDKTPAEEAGIKFPFHNWKDVVEQPYSETSRIKLKAALADRIKALKENQAKPQIVSTHISGIVSRAPHITARSSKLVKPHYSRRGGGLTRRGDI